MTTENNQLDQTRNMHDQCKRYAYHHVIFTMNDGRSFDGIIENVDRDNVTVLVGEDVMERESDGIEERQFYGYGRPRRRFRRFRRQVFPLAFLTALSLFPYAYPPYPYPYPFYFPYPFY